MGEWSITFDVVWSLFYLRVTWRKISLSKDQTIAHINAYYLLPDAGNFSPIDLFCFSFSLLHKCSPQMSASIFTLKTENVFQACNWLRVFALEMMPLNVSLQIENIIVFHRPVTLIPQSAAIWWVFFYLLFYLSLSRSTRNIGTKSHFNYVDRLMVHHQVNAINIKIVFFYWFLYFVVAVTLVMNSRVVNKKYPIVFIDWSEQKKTVIYRIDHNNFYWSLKIGTAQLPDYTIQIKSNMQFFFRYDLSHCLFVRFFPRRVDANRTETH